MTQSDIDTVVPHQETAKLLLDEWKFRQQHCWNILPRYGLAAVSVSVIPYLKIEIFNQFKMNMLIFPAIGWFLALAATWLFLAEQHRCHSVHQHYRAMLGKERIHIDDTKLHKALNWAKVRWTTPSIYFTSFTLLTIFNLIILSKLH